MSTLGFEVWKDTGNNCSTMNVAIWRDIGDGLTFATIDECCMKGRHLVIRKYNNKQIKRMKTNPQGWCLSI